jgi:hypothetical protein
VDTIAALTKNNYKSGVQVKQTSALAVDRERAHKRSRAKDLILGGRKPTSILAHSGRPAVVRGWGYIHANSLHSRFSLSLSLSLSLPARKYSSG